MMWRQAEVIDRVAGGYIVIWDEELQQRFSKKVGARKVVESYPLRSLVCYQLSGDGHTVIHLSPVSEEPVPGCSPYRQVS